MAALDRALASGQRWSGILDDVCRLVAAAWPPSSAPARATRTTMPKRRESGREFTIARSTCIDHLLTISGDDTMPRPILNIDDVEFRAWGHNAGWPVGMNAQGTLSGQARRHRPAARRAETRLQRHRRAAAQAGVSDAQPSCQRGNVFHPRRAKANCASARSAIRCAQAT